MTFAWIAGHSFFVQIFVCMEASEMIRFALMFGYVGPETVLPMTSVLATVGAFVMLFGKSLLRFVAY